MIQNFLIVAKDNNGNENLPSRSLYANIDGEKLYFGVAWVKKNQEGKTFLSCALNKKRTTDDGKEYMGYVIISEDEYTRLKDENAYYRETYKGRTSPTDEHPDGIDVINHPLNNNSVDIFDDFDNIGF